ncbi:MAG: alpha/beta hydrolase fold domain-containing protein, partial [Actinomycetota bacterium]
SLTLATVFQQEPLDDPAVSPLYAQLTGLPPVLVHVGSEEILLDDATRFVAACRAHGVDASLGCFPGLWHVFHLFPGVPEARHALREIGGFIRRHTDAATSCATAAVPPLGDPSPGDPSPGGPSPGDPSPGGPSPGDPAPTSGASRPSPTHPTRERA